MSQKKPKILDSKLRKFVKSGNGLFLNFNDFVGIRKTKYAVIEQRKNSNDEIYFIVLPVII